ncbi:MAG TPA: sodium-translocating pyrophosphatase [Humisphaera sp.]|jgi:K(+)-stimulated pyrophosphate-energized sodium pump|nr:sodium-translocating pyrophosphatase [Humisphaera sp.]
MILAQGGVIRGLNDLTPFEEGALWSVLALSIISILYALWLRTQVLAYETGTDRMREVWGWIRAGANAYLGRQFRSILIAIIVLSVLMFLSVKLIPPSEAAKQVWGDENAATAVAVGRTIAFLMGSLFSYLVGFVGMNVAVAANVRVAEASRRSYSRALQVAYRSGTVTGMMCVGLGLLGGTLIFLFYGRSAPDALLGFGFGGSLIALFMRVGGGIYTKAADVGADLVGKVEANLPEDDTRNAAVIADLVGDNVGDCAGMAADVFESFEVTMVAAMILGIVLGTTTGRFNPFYLIFPLLARGIGVIASIVGTYVVKTTEEERNAMKAMNRGFWLSAAIAIALTAVVALFYKNAGAIDWRPFLAILAGVLLAVVLDKITEYFTSTHYSPVQETSRSCQTGAATNILSGLALGFESSVYAILAIAGAILAAYVIFHNDPHSVQAILYGVALTGIGMLTLTGNTISMDAFGPISDNANGIGEMSGLEKEARAVMDDLDATGNTTKAITKGVAIGSAVIAAVALYGSFFADINLAQHEAGVAILSAIDVSKPVVFIGLLIGGALPFLFTGLTIRAVERAASQIVNEVRRQLRIPGIMERTVQPDYARAVGISTVAAQRELITLGVIAVATPIVVGFLLDVEALGGFLAGTILVGQLLAVFMCNAGGAWDNAKKYIEEGHFGGKRTDAHKAGVVGDTVGDPLKDTSGPALNPLLKVINLVALIIAPMIVSFRHKNNDKIDPATIIIMIVLIGAIIWAIARSKRSGEQMVENVAPATGGSSNNDAANMGAEEPAHRA